MNDLVHMMYNSKSKDKRFRNIKMQVEELHQYDERITERGNHNEDDDIF